jgi:NADPH-dependent 2,4-dienoyl-CoA reductase/sulfur reductase-like enzyme
MAEGNYKYIIVGGGLAGASAVEGIREKDKDGRILLVAREGALP